VWRVGGEYFRISWEEKESSLYPERGAKEKGPALNSPEGGGKNEGTSAWIVAADLRHRGKTVMP